ncbi:MAG: 3'(2'),5'-bisphosphate nucleotidase [Calditrichaeota bacterium]|nr:MAG: 3'(2'),5'-bisphosphate nucleotidase [Calditrichota bacterium]MBL1206004.1 3'(2'),5'-bisphosphate nucleotidase [Calditrichota bacterium]NOG45832.1 3'(2'),5'-bisphosphate nucleotidase [Calditrichota bacterium]
MEKYLNSAIKAVTAASMICSEIQAQLVSEDSITKKDKSPVTIADYASQAIVCSILNEQFPDIPIVGEEDSGSLKEAENKSLLDKIKSFLGDWHNDQIIDAIDLGNGEANDLFWTLDPIDGTKGFLRGEQYAVALALIKNGEIVLGVLGCPNLDYDDQNQGTLLYATKGDGSVACNFSMDSSRDINVSNQNPDEKVRFLESVETGHANHGAQAKIIDAFGERKDSVRVDSQVKYAVLAQGKAEVYLRLPKPEMPDYREKIWDHAAGVIIVEEAGGIISDINGNPLDFSQGKKLKNNRGVIGTNGQFHDMVLENVN